MSKDKAAWGVQILAALAASFFALGMGVAALFSLLNEGEPTRYRLLFPLAGLAVLAAVLLLVECFMRLRAAVRLWSLGAVVLVDAVAYLIPAKLWPAR